MKTPRRPLALLLIALACVGCSELEDYADDLRIRISSHRDDAREPILTGSETLSLSYLGAPFAQSALAGARVEWATLRGSTRTVVSRTPTLRAADLPRVGGLVVEVWVWRDGDIGPVARRWVYVARTPAAVSTSDTTTTAPAPASPLVAPAMPTPPPTPAPRGGITRALGS